MIETEVVLVSKKSENDDVRWVYLDIGKFGGLAETLDESIRYPIRTPRDRLRSHISILHYLLMKLHILADWHSTSFLIYWRQS